jgi:hypothetical protein
MNFWTWLNIHKSTIGVVLGAMVGAFLATGGASQIPTWTYPWFAAVGAGLAAAGFLTLPHSLAALKLSTATTWHVNETTAQVAVTPPTTGTTQL